MGGKAGLTGRRFFPIISWALLDRVVVYRIRWCIILFWTSKSLVVRMRGFPEILPDRSAKVNRDTISPHRPLVGRVEDLRHVIVFSRPIHDMDPPPKTITERQQHSPYRGFVAGVFSGVGKLSGGSSPIVSPPTVAD